MLVMYVVFYFRKVKHCIFQMKIKNNIKKKNLQFHILCSI